MEALNIEGLQEKLIAEISKQLAEEKKNIQLLDVLNRLLGTVNGHIVATK